MQLARPLWTETQAFRRYRRRRFAFLAPVAAFAGALWGGALGGGVGAAAGAGPFAAGGWLHTRLYPAVLQWAQQGWGLGRAAGLLWDVVVVGGGGLVVTRGLGLEWPPAVTSALVLGGGAALGFAWLMDEGGTAMLHALVSPLGRRGVPRPPFSHIEAKLVCRDFAAARAALEEMVERHPGDPRGWASLGEILAGPLGEPSEAVRVWADGLHEVQGSLEGERVILARIAAFGERSDPAWAAALLRRYADRWGAGPEAEWARRTLARLQERGSSA
jgi:hypothetical protein